MNRETGEHFEEQNDKPDEVFPEFTLEDFGVIESVNVPLQPGFSDGYVPESGKEEITFQSDTASSEVNVPLTPFSIIDLARENIITSYPKSSKK